MNTNTPPLAMLREAIGRYRWVAAGVAVEFAAMLVAVRVLPPSRVAGDWSIGLAIQFLLTVFLGLLVIFAWSVPRPGRGVSGYPARMFLLPVSNVGLAGWPMVFGMAAMAGAWAVSATLILPRLGFWAPLGPGMLAASATITCIQAIGWWPFATNLGMLLASVATLPALALPILLPAVVEGQWSWTAWALPPAYIAGAWWFGVRAIALDRRGDGRSGGGWRSIVERFERVVDRLTRDATPFASPARAQAWFEWRTKGVALILLVVAVASMLALIFAMLPLLAWAGRSRSPQPAGIAIGIGLAALTICWIMGSSFAKDELSSRTSELSPFLATRPISTGELASLRTRAAAVALVSAFVVVAAILSPWAVATGQAGEVLAAIRAAVDRNGVPATAATLGLGAIVALIQTWKGMVGGIVPALAGRPWVALWAGNAAVLAALLAAAVGYWAILDVDRLTDVILPAATAMLPWVLAAALTVKLAIGSFLYATARRRRLISGRAVAVGSAIALASAAAAFGLGAIVARPSSPSIWLDLALAAAVSPPWGRLAAAPLALDWNRHR